MNAWEKWKNPWMQSSSKGKSYWAAHFIGCLIKSNIFCGRSLNPLIGEATDHHEKIVVVLTEGSKMQYQVVLDKFNLSDDEKKTIFFIDWTGEQTREDFIATLNYIKNSLRNDVKLLLVDSLTQVLTLQKNDDINSALDKIHLFNECTKLFPDCAKVYIAHPGKPAKENRGKETKEQFLNTFDKYNIIGSSNYVNLPRQILMTNSFIYNNKLYFFVKKDKDNTAFDKSIATQKEESQIQQFVFEDNMYIYDESDVIDEYFSSVSASYKPRTSEIIENLLRMFSTKPREERKTIIAEFKSSCKKTTEINPMNMVLYLYRILEAENTYKITKDAIRSVLYRKTNTLKTQIINILNDNTYLL